MASLASARPDALTYTDQESGFELAVVPNVKLLLAQPSADPRSPELAGKMVASKERLEVDPDKLRSPSKVLIDKLYPDDVPDGFPVGPHPNFNDNADGVVPQVKKWAADVKYGGGAFYVWQNDGYDSGAKVGPRRKFVCWKSKKPQEGQSGTSCPWKCAFELTTKGWVLKSGCLEHNHELMQTTAEVKAKKAGRDLPKELIELGELLQKAGQSASYMMDVFAAWAHENDVEVDWTYQDVFDRFKPSAESKVFDATKMMEMLEERVRTREFPT